MPKDISGGSCWSVHAWLCITTLALIASVTGSLANFSCNTVSIPQFETGSSTNNNNNGTLLATGGFLHSGPFSYRSNRIVFVDNSNPRNTSTYAFDTCRYYSMLKEFGHSWDEDALTTGIRAFAAIATAFGTVALGGTIMVPCCGTTVCLWNIYGLLFVLASVFQGLCLTITKSSLCTNNPILQILGDRSSTSNLADSFAPNGGVVVCDMAFGYNCGIVATVFWAVAGICALLSPAPQKWQDDWCSQPTNTNNNTNNNTHSSRHR